MQKFEPFQKVLVREDYEDIWSCDLYSHFEDGLHVLVSRLRRKDTNILPYAGNEHLLGTTDSPTPKWEPKPGELVAVRQSDKTSWRPRVFAYRKGKYFVCQHEEFHNVKDDGWHYCEPLRKHFKVPEE